MRFRRARAAPRWRHSVRTLWKGTARARGRGSFGATPVLPRASPAPHRARWLAACSALARHCARSLWGRGPARALPTRARAAPSRRHSLHTPWKGTARAGGCRSVGARPLLSRASLPSHCVWWLPRVARLRSPALARSLWGRGQARALPPRARRAALATLGPFAMEGHCTSERPPFRRRQAPAPSCQPSLSLRVVACACSALARHCARSLWRRGPARALPTRARAAPSQRHSVHTR